jgi:hypothetical protein
MVVLLQILQQTTWFVEWQGLLCNECMKALVEAM